MERFTIAWVTLGEYWWLAKMIVSVFIYSFALAFAMLFLLIPLKPMGFVVTWSLAILLYRISTLIRDRLLKEDSDKG